MVRGCGLRGEDQPAAARTVLRAAGPRARPSLGRGDAQAARRAQRPEAMAGSVNVVSALIESMSDASVASSSPARSSRSAARPNGSRTRSRRSCPTSIGSASCSGWRRTKSATEARPRGGRVRGAVAARRDDADVVLRTRVRLRRLRARAVARAARCRRRRAVSDDPPERIAAWLATVSDASLRSLDHQLLLDLLASRPTRRAGATSPTPSSPTPRTWSASATSIRRGSSPTPSSSEGAARPARSRTPRRARAVRPRRDDQARAAHLRGADDEAYERFKSSATRSARRSSRRWPKRWRRAGRARARRLRDILVGFGPRGASRSSS